MSQANRTNRTLGSSSIGLSPSCSDKPSSVLADNAPTDGFLFIGAEGRRSEEMFMGNQKTVGDETSGTPTVGKRPDVSNVPRIRTALKSRDENDASKSRAASPGLPQKVTFNASSDEG